MKLHEYQAKELMKGYGIAVPLGAVARTPAEARDAAHKLGGTRWLVKAQVHTGGRGKAGGIKMANSLEEVQRFASDTLGKRLVTYQSGPHGQPVDCVWIEQPANIAKEFYLSALIDRARRRVVFVGSTEGGMEIEEVAHKHPEKIIAVADDPTAGLQAFHGRDMGFALGLPVEQVQALSKMMLAMHRMFMDKDLSMIEINPLALTPLGEFIALDAKITVDDNALYRQKAIEALRDDSQDDDIEVAARKHDLNYVTLDGTIGCMVNGAGLAMATMDLIKLHGGEPANFLDVGGGTTADRVAEAFHLILSDKKVKAILVNIFGGIVRCDLIAEGIIKAAKTLSLHVPVVVRLEGTNVAAGREMLNNSGLDLYTAKSLADAAKQVVKAAQGQG
ncbi:MAG: ADP-forming succinate--CoA ligase subunit beta [Pseudomonadota bacterium]